MTNPREELKERDYVLIWEHTFRVGSIVSYWSKEVPYYHSAFSSSNLVKDKVKKEIILIEYETHFNFFQSFTPNRKLSVEENYQILDDPHPQDIIKKQKSEIERLKKLNDVLTDRMSGLQKDFKEFLKKKFGAAYGK